jgi:hypothetical protein
MDNKEFLKIYCLKFPIKLVMEGCVELFEFEFIYLLACFMGELLN